MLVWLFVVDIFLYKCQQNLRRIIFSTVMFAVYSGRFRLAPVTWTNSRSNSSVESICGLDGLSGLSGLGGLSLGESGEKV